MICDNDFLIYNDVLYEYRGPGRDVIIPEGVKRIRKDAFSNCTEITSVVLPRGIERIPNDIFENCCALKEATLYNDYPDNNIGYLFGHYAEKYKIRERENFLITMLDAENNAIRYKVLFVNENYRINRFFRGLSEEDAWGKNGSFNFVKLDELFESYKNITNRLLTAHLRLKYPIDLDEKTRGKYESFIKRNGYKAFPDLIKSSNVAVIKAFLDMEAINRSRIDSMIETATKSANPEIIALLIDYKQRILEEPSQSFRFSSKPIEEWKVKKETPELVWRYTGNETEVVLPSEISGVRCIGVADTVSKKPENYLNIEKIIIPEGYKIIGKDAFSGCSKLIEVVLPQSLEALGEKCFAECRTLEKINLPDSLKTIPNEAFHGCKKLSQINLPNGLLSIGDEAFRGCDSLKEIDLGESFKEFGVRSFYMTKLDTVIFRGKSCGASYGICFEESPRHVYTDGEIYAQEIVQKSKMPLSYLGLKPEELIKSVTKDYLAGLTVYGYGELQAFRQIENYLYHYSNISFSEFITALGGIYSNILKKTVDLAVFSEIDPENATVQRALKWGTAIISELDFLKAIQKKEKLNLDLLRKI